MKQFMSLSALILSAACLCAHTPSFANDSLDKAGQATGKVVDSTVGAAGDVVNGIGKGLQRISDSFTSGFKKLTRHNPKQSKNKHNTPNQNKSKNGETMPDSALPSAAAPGTAATVKSQPTSTVTTQPTVSTHSPTTHTTSHKTTTTTTTTTTPITAPTVSTAPAAAEAAPNVNVPTEPPAF